MSVQFDRLEVIEKDDSLQWRVPKGRLCNPIPLQVRELDLHENAEGTVFSGKMLVGQREVPFLGRLTRTDEGDLFFKIRARGLGVEGVVSDSKIRGWISFRGVRMRFVWWDKASLGYVDLDRIDLARLEYELLGQVRLWGETKGGIFFKMVGKKLAFYGEVAIKNGWVDRWGLERLLKMRVAQSTYWASAKGDELPIEELRLRFFSQGNNLYLKALLRCILGRSRSDWIEKLSPSAILPGSKEVGR